MSGSDIFAVIGSALDAQNDRMGAIASNLANVNSVAQPGGGAYRAHEVVFAAQPVPAGDDADGADADAAAPDMGVQVAGTVLSNTPPVQTYDPGSPFADAKGYVTGSNVSQVSQMVDLIDASSSYAASVAVLQQASRVDSQMLSSFQVT